MPGGTAHPRFGGRDVKIGLPRLTFKQWVLVFLAVFVIYLAVAAVGAQVYSVSSGGSTPVAVDVTTP